MSGRLPDCTCNGHASDSDCDPNGNCVGCTGNTVGKRCERELDCSLLLTSVVRYRLSAWILRQWTCRLYRVLGHANEPRCTREPNGYVVARPCRAYLVAACME